MLLLTDLTSAPDDKIIGIKYCQKVGEKVSVILAPVLRKYRRYYGINTNTAISTTLTDSNSVTQERSQNSF